MYKIGIGYDIHRLVKGRKLILAGIEVPASKGLLGYSDADVVLHAVIDALLGALGLGDIGDHFPDTDKKFKGISSKELLNKALAFLKSKKFKIENIDINIIIERPKLKNYKLKMRKNLAKMAGLTLNSVNIKAKTNEGLGEIGKIQAIAVQAALLIKKS